MAEKPLVKFVHLYSWNAPDRFWTPKDKNWYLWYSLVFVIFIFLAALTEQYFVILGLIALLFLIFAQGATPPRELQHEITNRGLKAFDDLYRWSDIDRFWVSERVNGGLLAPLNGQKGNHRVINFDMSKKNPPRLSLLIGSGDEETIVFSLLEYIPYAEPEEASTDFLTRIVYGKHIPLKDYMSTSEEFPATNRFPEQQIESNDKTDPKYLSEVLSREQKEKLRQQQLAVIHGTAPEQNKPNATATK